MIEYRRSKAVREEHGAVRSATDQLVRSTPLRRRRPCGDRECRLQHDTRPILDPPPHNQAPYWRGDASQRRRGRPAKLHHVPMAWPSLIQTGDNSPIRLAGGRGLRHCWRWRRHSPTRRRRGRDRSESRAGPVRGKFGSGDPALATRVLPAGKLCPWFVGHAVARRTRRARLDQPIPQSDRGPRPGAS